MGLETNNWAEWRNHILAELERLNANYKDLSEMFYEIEEKALALETQESNHLRLAAEVDRLKTFKIQALAIWGCVQVAAGFAGYFIGLKR